MLRELLSHFALALSLRTLFLMSFHGKVSGQMERGNYIEFVIMIASYVTTLTKGQENTYAEIQRSSTLLRNIVNCCLSL